MINKLHVEMIKLYSKDVRRIQHFCKVHSYAKLIGEMEQVDADTLFILEAAALTHDIGIHICEEKYGECNGKLQEKEGPAIAKELLERLHFEERVSKRVQYLIAHHHTYDAIDGNDYQILVEADFLVNLYEDGLSGEAAANAYEKIFRTDSGRRICREMFDFPLESMQNCRRVTGGMEVTLSRAQVEDAREIHAMQVESFKELLEKYQDFDTSPASESWDKVEERLKQDFTYYYFVCAGQQKVGAVRVIDTKEAGKNKRISPLFILPEFQGKGIAQKAIRLCEEMHGNENWELDTILQEQGNCHLYEKMGYRQTGRMEAVNERMTLVFYKKNIHSRYGTQGGELE